MLIDLAPSFPVDSVHARLSARREPMSVTRTQLTKAQELWAQGKLAYLYYDGSIDSGESSSLKHQLVQIATKGFPVIMPVHGLFEVDNG